MTKLKEKSTLRVGICRDNMAEDGIYHKSIKLHIGDWEKIKRLAREFIEDRERSQYKDKYQHPMVSCNKTKFTPIEDRPSEQIDKELCESCKKIHNPEWKCIDG